ncbi:DUF3892 domain-containing protein [Algoriphagus sp. AGSA1]|uniref:DUF3892 domain-containing protein n=1 Tax=unclassified Algoriphagus TaxID=2641541 RepID=UPI001784644B|nr:MULTISPECIES: DUF3892 domain-containing protein [unclassified Algoriphagus]MCE7056285.1 DUF3892 domain-containing protein [Algoriphagus sp. AGSA1]
MKRLRILCTKKLTQGTFEGDITHIGGVNGTGEKWNISVKEAVDGIMSGAFEFYIVEQFEEINVQVTGEIEKSLTAKGQGYLHNLLLDLPDCP